MNEDEVPRMIHQITCLSFPHQVSYGFAAHTLGEKTRSSFFYRLIPKEEPQYTGIVQLLLHFRWNWVGLLALDNEHGVLFLRTMEPLLQRSGVCVPLVQRVPMDTVFFARMMETLLNVVLQLAEKKVTVFVYYGDSRSMIDMIFLKRQLDENLKPHEGKLWIIVTLQDVAVASSLSHLHHIHGALSFSVQTKKKRKYNPLDDRLVQQFGKAAFLCSDSVLPVSSQIRCRERLDLSLPQDISEKTLSGDSYSLYASVQAVAHAVTAAYSSRPRWRGSDRGDPPSERQRLQSWQVCLLGTSGSTTLDRSPFHPLVFVIPDAPFPERLLVLQFLYGRDLSGRGGGPGCGLRHRELGGLSEQLLQQSESWKPPEGSPRRHQVHH